MLVLEYIVIHLSLLRLIPVSDSRPFNEVILEKMLTHMGMVSALINPRRACAARVTVVVLCVCVCVCLSVCLSVCYHSSSGIVHFYAPTNVPIASIRNSLSFCLVDFDKNAWFRSYGIICSLRQHPALLQRPLASFSDGRGF